MDRMCTARLIRLLIATVTLAGSVLLDGPSATAAESAVQVGIFDLEEITNQVKPEAAVRNDTRSKENPLKGKEADEIRTEIRRLTQELERTKGLSKAERESRLHEIGKVRKKLTRLKTEPAKAAKKAKKEFTERILAAVADYGTEQGFAVLFEKGHWSEEKTVVLTSKAVDITQEIIKRLKAKSS